MKFLADQDVYAGTVKMLRDIGHDVQQVAQLGMAQASDVDLLQTAREQSRIFITRDRDFGNIVFIEGGGPGVLYLRMLPSTQNAVHAELQRVLSLYTEQQLFTCFVVIEPGRHRIRQTVKRDHG